MHGHPAQCRIAQPADLPAIVALLADDPLGQLRESPSDELHEAYGTAFSAIAHDQNNELVVVEVDGQIAGVMQLTFLPGLTYSGGWRAQIEGVRVHRDERGKGIGHAMVGWAIDRARERGCVLLQLTTDKQRPDAIRFYEGLGFSSSHEGMKLRL